MFGTIYNIVGIHNKRFNIPIIMVILESLLNENKSLYSVSLYWQQNKIVMQVSSITIFLNYTNGYLRSQQYQKVLHLFHQ